VSEPYLRQWESLMGDQAGALAQVDRVVSGQAHLMATNDLMMLAGAIMGSLVLVAWVAKPPFGARGGGGH
jgi:DHA2 family multidrug resistance protein